MKQSNPMSLARRNRLSALLVTTLVAAIYYALFHGFISFMTPEALWSVWAHIAFVWVPLTLAAIFYAWAIRPLPISRPQRVLTTLAASVAATVSGALLFDLLWFHQLPVIK
jgi:hypothetical protein